MALEGGSAGSVRRTATLREIGRLAGMAFAPNQHRSPGMSSGHRCVVDSKIEGLEPDARTADDLAHSSLARPAR